MKIKCLFFILFLQFANGSSLLQAQDKVSIEHSKPKDTLIKPSETNYTLSPKKLIIPSVLIGYGVASLKIDGLRQLNLSTRYEITEHKPDKIKLDNYTQYLPAAMVYGLNMAGVEGKHNLKDRTLIYATSQLIAASVVLPLKFITQEERPDGSNALSFPSGHTTTAFSSAQFLFREYRDTHFWLSISGYPIAIFTGVYRALNNKHWVGDIVAGAGFGILSTELAYWLYPKLKQWLFKNNNQTAIIIAPFYQDHALGLGLVKRF